MAKEFIVNEDYVITITPNGAWVPGPAIGHNYIEQKTTKTKMNNKFVVQTPLTWTALGCTLAAHSFVTGSGTINSIAIQTNWEGIKCLRENDQGTCNGSFNQIPGPGTTNCNCTFRISNAGQAKARGE